MTDIYTDLGLGHEWNLKGEGNANAVFAYRGAAAHLVCHQSRISFLLLCKLKAWQQNGIVL